MFDQEAHILTTLIKRGQCEKGENVVFDVLSSIKKAKCVFEIVSRGWKYEKSGCNAKDTVGEQISFLDFGNILNGTIL